MLMRIEYSLDHQSKRQLENTINDTYIMREPTAYNINEDQIDPFNRQYVSVEF